MTGLWLNSGGPSSRTRNERIVSSLLGGNGPIRMRGVLHAAIDFGDLDPVGRMEEALREAGFTDPETLRGNYELPAVRLIARPYRGPALTPAVGGDADDLLRVAIILGLSTATLYDPGRPVLWTTASLTRRLELFEAEGYYA